MQKWWICHILCISSILYHKEQIRNDDICPSLFCDVHIIDGKTRAWSSVCQFRPLFANRTSGARYCYRDQVDSGNPQVIVDHLAVHLAGWTCEKQSLHFQKKPREVKQDGYFWGREEWCNESGAGALTHPGDDFKRAAQSLIGISLEESVDKYSHP